MSRKPTDPSDGYVSPFDTTYEEDSSVDWTGNDFWSFYRVQWAEYGDESAFRKMLEQVTKLVPRKARPRKLDRRWDRGTWLAVAFWVLFFVAACILPWILRLRERRCTPYTGAMAKTHHATRLFRLGCGCLRDYPGMAAGRRHDVLCTACNIATTTLYAYPERRCGAESIIRLPGNTGVMRVSCTRPAGNIECQSGVHHDEFVKASFSIAARLRRGSWGNTGRA